MGIFELCLYVVSLTCSCWFFFLNVKIKSCSVIRFIFHELDLFLFHFFLIFLLIIDEIFSSRLFWLIYVC